ncbi:MAG TPA: hypothetical protein VI248_18685 [Kineosporiaceae bacterium]
MTADPFATAEVRERVLTAWAAAPVRFREDANAEEDHALGSYRDRLIVELAQNAADAAQQAGVPGHLLLALRELDGRAVLVAANTGAPLTGEGVLGLATLRASAKRDDATVGRFGVGFSAVLAVTDEPAVISRAGGVRFSAADTRALVAGAAAHSRALADELARRDGHVPVLRLPFPAYGMPPAGYDTAVLLPLRDAVAEDIVARLLTDVGDPLLLALPALAEVVVEVPGVPVRCIRDVGTRWHVHRRHGRLDPALLAGRPTEERRRTVWSVTWALPRDDAGAAGHLPGFVHAPTVTDEPLPWPALLIAPFPLDTGRRHVAPGPATDALVRQAAEAYVDLLQERAAAGAGVWSLIPVGLAHGALDGALRETLRPLLPGAPLLRAAEEQWSADAGAGDPALLRPRDAVVLEPPAGADPVVVAGLASAVAGLVLARRSAGPALDLLGIRRVALADVIEQLPAPHDPAYWRRLYSALAALVADPLAREALGALPVPLADGRVVRGVRGLALPDPGGDPEEQQRLGEALATLGVRVVHPAAVHPLLEQLGAVRLDPRAALELPAVRAAVRAAADDDDLGLADAVLEVAAAAVAAGRLAPGDLPWLADLPLPDAEDDVTPAALLALPGSFAARVLDPDDIALVEDGVVERWGVDVLAAVGVLDGPAVLRLPDVVLAGPGAVADDDEDGPRPADLDGFAEWAEESVRSALAAVGVADPDDDAADDTDAVSGLEVGLPELVAVRDLDAVVDDAWPELLDRLAGEPVLRTALLHPARVVVRWIGGGGTADVPSYTAWWLRRAVAGGPWADPEAEPLFTALLPPPPPLLAGMDREVRHAAGAVCSASDLDAAAVEAVLAGMADPDVEIDAPGAIVLWRDLAVLAASVLADGTEVAPPAWVRVLDGLRTRVVRVRDAVVVDGPAWLQRSDLGGAVVAPDVAAASALADLLDVPLAAELALGKVEENGQVVPTPEAVRVLLPGCPPTWCEHEELVVDGVDVNWWVEGHGPDALVHASTFEGLAKGLSWAAGAWRRRGAVSDVLADANVLAMAVVDEAFG